MLDPKQTKDLTEKVLNNANSQKNIRNALNYLESCIKHGNELGQIAAAIRADFLSRIHFSI